MIKVILWDIDGTVLNFLAQEEASIRKCFELFGLGECNDAMLNEYSAINATYWPRMESGELTKQQVLVQRFEEFFGNHDIDTGLAEAFNETYQKQLGETIVFNPNALGTIRTLKGRVIQCASTNGTVTAAHRKLSKSGLDQILEHLFISEEIGIEKPNIGFFEKIFAVLPDYQKDEFLIVGDSLTSDIKGGNNAGILTCYYNPDHKTYRTDLRIDYEIDDLKDIISIINEQ